MHGDVLLWFGEDSTTLEYYDCHPNEANWALSNLLEVEAESVMGYNVEYLLMGFASFLSGEYANMIFVRCGALYLTFLELPLLLGANVPSTRALYSKLLWLTV
ncbi:hypothetical protein KP509_07G077600 [Ceratopteris richardii]|uniref:Uncharacterized protein n=1 Tax=Ceratopteris richardii TaxID=49495 RepID=A0A8T2UGI7_CERRI|nr:hypothetical protein KP509_07G077600 [Ceratopteris richardii]